MELGWVIHVATSEFVWGVILGLLLAIVVAIATSWLEDRRRRRVIAAFCQDLVGNICDCIKNLEDSRTRQKVIYHEFLDLISVEVGVYGRNREHIILLADGPLRNEVRNFFTRVAVLTAQIKFFLGQFDEANRAVQSIADPQQRGHAQARSTEMLTEAHTNCDRLREMQNGRKDLEQRLEAFSRLWW